VFATDFAVGTLFRPSLKKGFLMRQRFVTRLLSSAALAAVLSLGGIGGVNAEDAAKADDAGKTVTFDPDSVTTFSGAFLAARTADVDHDYPTAIELYKKALQIEPGNPEIRQRLMISLLLNGDIKDGVKYANDLKGDPTVERITTIVRGMDAMRRGEFKSAESILKYDGPNDLDRMMNDLLLAWARVGAGRGKEGLAMVEKMKGPDWVRIFQNYNAGAIAIVPAAFVTIWYGDQGTAELLILTQVVLSLQLSFAVFPLVMFTASKAKMGELVAPKWLSAVAYVIAVVIAGLNVKLLLDFVTGG